MPENENISNKRIAKNTIFLYIRMVMVMATTFYTSRILLKELGVIDYGIYNVVGGIVGMISFLNTSLSNGYQRFYNFSIGKRDNADLQKVFSSSLLIQVALIVVSVIICETLGLWFLENKMTIPEDRMYAAECVFQTSLIIFITVLIRVPYYGLIIAYEKMKVFSYISIIEVCLQLGMVYMLSIFQTKRLIVYGCLMAAISIFVMFTYIYFARKCNKNLYSKPNYHKQILRQMLGFSGWNILGSLAHLFRTNGLNILLNMFFNPAVNAANSFANQVNSGVNALANNVQTASNPQIIKRYAQNQRNLMLDLSFNVQRYIFYLLWLISFPIMLKIDYVFHIWLGEDVPRYSQIFTKLTLCASLIDAFAAPMSTLIYATGEMKRYQLYVSIINILFIPLSYIGLKIGLSPAYVFYAAIAISIIAQSCRIWVVKIQIPEFSLHLFFTRVCMPICILVIFSLLIVGALQRYVLGSTPEFMNLTMLFILTAIIIMVVGLNKKEKAFLFQKIKSIV